MFDRPWRFIAREWSTWMLALAGVIPVVEAVVIQINTNPDMGFLGESPYWRLFSLAIACLGIIVKNIPQPKLDEEERRHRDGNS